MNAHTQNLTGVAVEVLTTSRVEAPRRQVSWAHRDISPANDGGNNSSRIAALEKRKDMLEHQQVKMSNWMQEIDRRLKKLGG